LNTSTFDNNLNSTNTDLQSALDSLDEVVGGGGTGTGVPGGSGSEVQYRVNATDFGAIGNSSFTSATNMLTINNLTANNLTSGDVSSTEFQYLNGVTSAIQTQLGNKEAADATLTDIADGTIAENLVNTANPWADNEVSDTLTASIVSDADKGDVTISSGDWAVEDDSHAHVIANVDAFTSAALFGQSSDETGSGLLVGNEAPTIRNATMIGDEKAYSFPITNATATADSGGIWECPWNATLTYASALARAGTNIVGNITECDANGANCIATHADLTATSTKNSTTTFTNADIDAGDYIGWNTTSVSGTVNATIAFRIKRTN
jgi:hypothetical protein